VRMVAVKTLKVLIAVSVTPALNSPSTETASVCLVLDLLV